MSHQIQSLTIWDVYLHDIAYPKSHLVTIDANIVQMNLKNFPNHGTSYTRLPVPHFLRIMVLYRKLFKPLKKPYKNPETIILTHFCLLSATQNQKHLWCILLRVADEKGVANTSTFTELKRKHQNETQEVYQSREFQPLNRNDTLRYRQNNNCMNWNSQQKQNASILQIVKRQRQCNAKK